MKIRYNYSIVQQVPILLRNLFTKRISFFIILLSFAALSLNAQNQKITVKESNKALSEVLNQIESKSGYTFLVRSSDINMSQKVSIDASGKNINEVLAILFKNSEINYELSGKNISIFIPQKKQSTKEAGDIRKITGVVTDEEGTPIIGANVVVKGQNKGTITDVTGAFQLEVNAASKSLNFSYVGYDEQEVDLTGKSVLKVQMIPSSLVLNEVVAIGYGSVKKSDLTGAVGTLGGDKIASRKSNQVSQALQGAIPGLMVTRTNNAPGATSTIRVRGITTIGDSNPLIILDGVPVDDINNINANDIENISVLKDAASASIYGSRAASGVILVTTKRAKSGAVSLTYSAEYGIEKPTRLPEYVDVKRYMQLANELRWNDNNNPANEYPLYPQATIEKYDSLNLANPNKYPNTDWIDLILEKNAPRQSHSVNISAGSNIVRTNASIAYDKTDGLFENKGFERITARLNNDFTINEYFSAVVDLSLKRSIYTAPYHDPIYNMLIAPAVYAAKWSDGRVADGKTGANAWGMMKYGGYKNSWYNLLSGKISVDFKPFTGMKISAVFSPTLGYDKSKNFNTKVPYYAADDPTVLSGYLEGCATTNLYENRNDYNRYTSQLLANYSKSFNKHNLNFLAGYESYYSFNENLGASREKYELTSYPYLNLGPLDTRGNSGNAWENAYQSYFGRVMYNFNSKYYMQANVRYDGSSRFDQNYRRGRFLHSPERGLFPKNRL